MLRTVLEKAFPTGCELSASKIITEEADCTAKTGQTLIATDAFQGLPDVPKEETETMEVDQPAVPAATAEATAEDGEKSTSEKKEEKPVVPAKKAYVPQADPITGDLVPECAAYLRLLIILANLDAKRVKEVSCPL